jgi:HD-GYP domain-containing protein (c-di-GMP phosphodiesterase class II)
MTKRRISLSDIVIGEPLAWDIYDSSHKLLLRKEYIVRSEVQVEALVRRGLFIDAKAAESKPPEQQFELPSALRFINQANKRLARLLYNLPNESGFEAKIMEVAAAIKQAVDINENVALASIMHNRAVSAYAVRHCIDTAIVSLLVARGLQIPEAEIDMILGAALTMNIGMLSHQEQLQAKGRLSDEDRDVIKHHPQIGFRLLKQAGIANVDWLMHVLMHHESEDGSGYPGGKPGTKIPLGTKLISIADRYCAKISPRAYRKAMLPNAALRSILVDEKQNVNQVFAAVFMRVMGLYPTGAFVRLENGEMGVVTKKGQSTKTPIVHALIGPRDAPLAFPIQRDTSRDLYAVRDLICETKAGIHVNMQQLWGYEASL